MTKGTGRRQRRAAETRLRLFRAALTLFAEHGFQNVTVGQITEAADVGKGTFFNYFESKDHVLGVMGDIQLGKVFEAASRSNLSQGSIRSGMHDLALRLIEEPGRSPELARAVVSAFLASKVVRDRQRAQITHGRRLFARLVERGQQRGEIDPSLDGKAVAIQFQQTVMGTILLWSLHGRPSLASWMEESYQHFWRAVAARDAERGR